MGQKFRFRFADMIPNAWFYKLKDMGKHKHSSNPSNEKSTTNSSLLSSSSSASSASSSSSSSSSVSVAIPNHAIPEQRKSYYFTREITSQIPNSHRHSDKQLRLESPPRKSSRGRLSTRRSRVSRRDKQRPVTASGCNCSTPKSPLPDPTCAYEKDAVQAEFGSGEPDGVLYRPTSSECHTQNNPIDEDHKLGKSLHRINTKKNASPTKIQINPLFVKTESLIKDSQKTPTTPVPVRRFPANPTSPGVKLRPNSPRIGNRRIQTRKNVGSMRVLESFAVVKSSKNPRCDFTSSMLEMIVENNLRGSKELEDLLACYLSLNADEYHDLIISVFKQIWFDVFHAPAPVGNK